MHILAIDTATNSGGVALSRGTELLGIKTIQSPRSYSEKIISAVDWLLTNYDLKIKDIDCVVTSVGPGSFTGIRIGLSTVKAFCQPLGIPAVGISTLAALAYRFSHISSHIAPIINAGRKQIYGAVYQIKDSEINIESPEQVLPPNEWLASIPTSQYLFVGDGVGLYENKILSMHPKAQVLATNNQIIEHLCLVGHSYFRKGHTLKAANLAANYIRPSDAELKHYEEFGHQLF